MLVQEHFWPARACHFEMIDYFKSIIILLTINTAVTPMYCAGCILKTFYITNKTQVCIKKLVYLMKKHITNGVFYTVQQH